MEGNDVFEIPIRWFPKINLNFCSEFPRNYNNILSIEELHYLLSMIIRFNTAFESYVLRWIGGRLNSCSMITKNRAAFESCSAIVRELNSRGRGRGRGEIPKQRNWNCATETTQLRAHSFRISVARYLCRFTRKLHGWLRGFQEHGCKDFARILSRVSPSVHTCFTRTEWLATGQVHVVDDTFARRSSKRPYEGHAWIIQCVSLV